MNRGRIALGIGMLLVVLATGCGSGGGDGGGDASATTDPAATRPVEQVRSVDEAPELADDVGVFSDLDVESCETGPGEVSASGSLVNGADEQADFVIQVRWVATEGNGVIDADILLVRGLAPGDSVSWSARGTVPDAMEAECSFSARRGTVD